MSSAVDVDSSATVGAWRTGRTADLLALGAGIALPFSFAPYDLWPLAPLSIALFYALIADAGTRRACWLGALYGLGYFAFGVYWIYHSVHLFGAAVAPLAALITLLFVLVMASFPAVTALAFARLSTPGRPLASSLLFAGLWVLAELARGKIMGGFPWILVGYSQTSGPLGALAPLIGVYGISLLVVWLSALLAVAVLVRRRALGAIALAAWVLVPMNALLGGQINWSAPTGEALKLRLVQANIPQEMKFSQERLDHSLTLYTGLTLAELPDTDLVIWPETAIPTYMERVEASLAPFASALEERGIELLTGVFTRDGNAVYNSVRQLGGERGLYRKHHLVPFGEYMPFRALLQPLAKYIDIPMSDQARGSPTQAPLSVAGARIGVSICYEDVYGEELRTQVPDATLLVNVSNDAWFGDSAAPHQHEQKARMRARELARPLVRVTNTGVSSAIDHLGEVQGRIAHDTRGVLDMTVQPRAGVTPYARTGNWPVFLVALLLCVLCGYPLHSRLRPHSDGNTR